LNVKGGRFPSEEERERSTLPGGEKGPGMFRGFDVRPHPATDMPIDLEKKPPPHFSFSEQALP